MNTIKELQNSYPCESIWFMIDEDSMDAFYQEIKAMNLIFPSGLKPERKDIHTFMAINDDNTIAYVSAFIFGKVHDGKTSSPHKDVILVKYRNLLQNENPIMKDCR